jgi:DNA-binding transcriptional ArsR family regulator
MEPRGNAHGPAERRLDAMFLALADPTRRAILARLAQGEASVTELAKPFAMSQPAVSKHLKVLERAGLITVGQDAQRRPRRIETHALAEAAGWIERCRDAWEANYARLDTLLEALQREPISDARPQASRKRSRGRREG